METVRLHKISVKLRLFYAVNSKILKVDFLRLNLYKQSKSAKYTQDSTLTAITHLLCVASCKAVFMFWSIMDRV